ncbi:hypothetical protein GCM10029992_08870 [Glycomyces albus]
MPVDNLAPIVDNSVVAVDNPVNSRWSEPVDTAVHHPVDNSTVPVDNPVEKVRSEGSSAQVESRVGTRSASAPAPPVAAARRARSGPAA